jgi:TRAP-type mannitol/chloroaromatic compound transport system permease large subunit
MDPVIAGQVLAGLFFLAILGTLMFGYLVAFALGGLSIMFAVMGWMVGAFDMHLLSSLATRFFGVITNPVLIAVPLFVFMGVVLEKSRIAEVLLTTMGQLFGTLRGGLGFSVVIVGTMLAASTGVVGATVVTMGLLSLPAMMRAGYDPRIATGVICAAGTLGQIIPPSTVLIFLADILQGANAAAQMELGNFAPDTISVGDLFAGAFFPGLALAFLYGLYIAFRAFMDPASCPALPMTAEERSGLARRAVVALVPPMTLIIAVLGSIIAGIATPTESASVGSLGAIFLMIVKMLADHHLDDGSGNSAAMEKRLMSFWLGFLVVLIAVAAVGGAFGLLTLLLVAVILGSIAVLMTGALRARFGEIIRETNKSTMAITSMIFVILLGATAFALVFTRMGGGDLVENMLANMPGGQLGALFVVMAIMFILGFFLDTFEIVFIVVPITAPILLLMGMDPILLGVLIALNLQTSFLTPPFGFSLFYLRGVAPREIKTETIYRGVVPFVVIQLAMVVVVYNFPKAATWLPDYLFRSPPAVSAPASVDAVGAESDGGAEAEGGATFDLDGGAPEGEGGGAFDMDGGAPESDGGGGAFDMDGGAPESDGGGGAFDLDGGAPETEGGGGGAFGLDGGPPQTEGGN